MVGFEHSPKIPLMPAIRTAAIEVIERSTPILGGEGGRQCQLSSATAKFSGAHHCGMHYSISASYFGVGFTVKPVIFPPFITVLGKPTPGARPAFFGMRPILKEIVLTGFLFVGCPVTAVFFVSFLFVGRFVTAARLACLLWMCLTPAPSALASFFGVVGVGAPIGFTLFLSIRLTPETLGVAHVVPMRLPPQVAFLSRFFWIRFIRLLPIYSLAKFAGRL